MTTYLTIITTVLVLTQIIRVSQNALQIHRQNTLYKKQLGDLAEYELSKEDFDNQRMAYKLIIKYFTEKFGG